MLGAAFQAPRVSGRAPNAPSRDSPPVYPELAARATRHLTEQRPSDIRFCGLTMEQPSSGIPCTCQTNTA
jgi:hypothetical protein